MAQKRVADAGDLTQLRDFIFSKGISKFVFLILLCIREAETWAESSGWGQGTRPFHSRRAGEEQAWGTAFS